ncbi:hypothetical protein D3C87_481420 [compost metagenome]
MPQTQTPIEKLRNISNYILKPDHFHDQLAPAIADYTTLLFDIGAIQPDNVVDREFIELPYGDAIGTFWAAFCVKEIFRTQRFCRGLYLAIKDKLAQKEGPVQVLYAGTGPFAALALPVMIQFSPEEVQFSLLEINQNSYNKLLDVIAAFGLERYIKRIEIADATTYVLPDKEIDIVLSETLNRALITEPQVFIMLNIASQLGPDVVYLPQEIKVNLSTKTRSEKTPTNLKTLINFDLACMKHIISNSNQGEWLFDEVKYDIGDCETKDLYYTTEIKVYRDNFLGFRDSSLNLLEKVMLDEKDSKNLFFQYSATQRTGFKVSTRSMKLK